MTADKVKRSPYDQGYIDGLTAYAHWESGQQLVGTVDKTLREAVRDREDNWNYDTKESYRISKISESM